MEYEIFYLVGESKEGNLKKINGDVEKIVSRKGGKFLDKEFTLKRKMSYPISHEFRGTYIAKRFVLAEKSEEEFWEEKTVKDAIGEITRELNLYSDILRFIIVKADDLPEFKKEEKKIKEVKEQEIKKEKFAKPKEIGKEAPAEEKKEIQKSIEAEKEEKPKEAKKEKVSQEEIDKKLNEILNI